MGLTEEVEYAFENDGAVLCLWLNQVYDMFTKYVKDHAVITELLPYAQFKSQLKNCDYFIASNILKRIGGQPRTVWTLNFKLLRDKCDVEGFGEIGNEEW